MDEEVYEIVRFRFNGDNEVIRSGVTLEEAQDHCTDESTHDTEHDPPEWFDGYRQI